MCQHIVSSGHNELNWLKRIKIHCIATGCYCFYFYHSVICCEFFCIKNLFYCIYTNLHCCIWNISCLIWCCNIFAESKKCWAIHMSFLISCWAVAPSQYLNWCWHVHVSLGFTWELFHVKYPIYQAPKVEIKHSNSRHISYGLVSKWILYGYINNKS